MKTSSVFFLGAIVCAVFGCEKPTETTAGGGGGTMVTGGTGGTGGAEAGAAGSVGGTGTGGETVTGGGGTGGTGGMGPDCSNPLLAYPLDGSYSNPIGPLPDEMGGFFANRVSEVFDVDTVCSTLVIGLASFSNPKICSLPASIGVVAWSDPGSVLTTGETVPATVPTPVVLDLASADHSLYADSPQANVYRFNGTWSFKAGEPVFVGVQLQQYLCAVGAAPICDAASGVRYRPNEPGAGWMLMSNPRDDVPPQVPSVYEQMLFGLEDCQPI